MKKMVTSAAYMHLIADIARRNTLSPNSGGLFQMETESKSTKASGTAIILVVTATFAVKIAYGLRSGHW